MPSSGGPPGRPYGPWLVDEVAFDEFLRQLSDPSARRRFTHDFVSLWDARAQRLTLALSVGDHDDAEITLLSIRSSSAMLGAIALTWSADQLRTCLKIGDRAGAATRMPRFRTVGDRTCAELLALEDGRDGCRRQETGAASR